MKSWFRLCVCLVALQYSMLAFSEEYKLYTINLNELDQISHKIELLLAAETSVKKEGLLKRLLEVKRKKHQILLDKAHDSYDRALSAWFETKRLAKKPEFTTFMARVVTVRHEMQELYKKLFSNLHESSYEEIAFQVGYDLKQWGQTDESISWLKKACKTQTNGKFIAHANFELADLYFNELNMALARKHFAKAYALAKIYKNRDMMLISRYKEAWGDFNLHYYSDALIKLKEVIRLSDEADLFETQSVQLKNEALNDLVQVYAALSAPTEAIEFYSKQLPLKEYQNKVINLAKQLESQGKYPAAEVIYLFLFEKSEQKTEKVKVAKLLFSNYLAVENRDKLIDILSAAGDLCSSQTTPECLDYHEVLFQEAKRYHALGRKEAGYEDLELARSLYEILSDKFANKKEILEIDFHLAECLFDQKAYSKSLTYYERITKIPSENNSFYKQALENSVWMLEESLNADKIQTKIGLELQQTELEKKYILLSDKLSKHYLKTCSESSCSQKITGMNYRSALLEKKHGNFESFEKRAVELFQTRPYSIEVRNIVSSLLFSYEQRRDWQKLFQLALRVEKHQVEKNEIKFLERVNKYKTKSQYELIMAQYAGGDRLSKTQINDLALRLETLAFQTDHAEFRTKILNDSIRLYFKSENYLAALGQVEKSGVTYSADVIVNVIDAYVNELDFKKAIVWSYVLLKNDEKINKDPKVYYNLHKYHLLEGDVERAVKYLKIFISKSSPNEKELLDSKLEVAALYEHQKNNKYALQAYRQVLSSPFLSLEKWVEVQDRIAKIASKAEAKELLSKICNESFKRKGLLEVKIGVNTSYKSLFGRCDIFLLENKFKNYIQLKIRGNIKNLKKKIERKEKMMQSLQEQYEQIASKYGHVWALQSFLQIANLYFEYASSLRELSITSRIPKEVKNIFMREIYLIASSYESQAHEVLGKLLKDSYEQGLYLPVLVKATRQVKKPLNDIEGSSHLQSALKNSANAFNVKKWRERSRQLRAGLRQKLNEISTLKELAGGELQAGNTFLVEWILKRLSTHAETDSFVLNLKGVLSLKNSDYYGAKRLFVKAFEKNQSDIEPLVNISLLALRFGDLKQARSSIKMACQINRSKLSARGLDCGYFEGGLVK